MIHGLSHIVKHLTRESFSKHHQAFLCVLGFGILVLAIAGRFEVGMVRRLIGPLSPALAIIIVSIPGFIAFRYLNNHAGLLFYSSGSKRGIIIATALSLFFGLTMISIDLLFRFPSDIAVLWPASLFFYPGFGILAELVFHLIPMSIIYCMLSFIGRNLSTNTKLWVSIISCSLIEASFQIVLMVQAEYLPTMGIILAGCHIALFGFSQLVLFKKFDFLSLLCLRFMYYIQWHFIWGELRNVLFN